MSRWALSTPPQRKHSSSSGYQSSSKFTSHLPSQYLTRLRVVDQPSTLLCDLVPVTFTLSLIRVIRDHNVRVSRVILQSYIALFNHLVEKRQVKQVSDLHEVSLVTVNSWEVVLLVSVWSQLPISGFFKLSHKLCLEVLHFLVRTS